MFFLLCAIALLMLLVPFAAGIFAGGREGKRPFFVTLGAVVLFELLAILIVLPARDALKEVLFCLLVHEVLPVAGVPALTGIAFFLLGWNCRRNSAAAWKGILWGVAFFLFGGVFFLPLSAALAAVIALFTVPRSLPVLGIMYGTVLWGLLGGVIWTLFTFKNAKKDFRHILRAGAVHAAAVLLFWGGATLMGILMVQAMERLAAELHIPTETVRQEPPAELKPALDRINAFWVLNMRYSPPFSGSWAWNDRPHAISPELRRFTLKFFDGPEVRKFMEDTKLIARQAGRKDVMVIAGFQYYRSLIRSRCDRTALFSIAGREEKILPELLLAAEELKIVPEDSPFRMAHLVRANGEIMWLSVLVPFAPDGPEYAPVYRKLLAGFRRDKISIPHEAGACLGLTDSGSGPLERFFYRCAFDTYRSAGFYHAIRNIPHLRVLEKREVFTEPLGYEEQHAQTLRRGLVACRLGLALKCHRSEKGKYPASLRELVPTYLEKIPPDPVTGKSIAYSSDGKDFKLSFSARTGDPNSFPLALESKPHVK